MNKHINQSDLEARLRSAGRQIKVAHGLKQTLKGDIMSQIVSKSIHQTKPWYTRALSWAPAMAAILVIVTSGTAVFADSAKPGDFLYPIDKLTESVALDLLQDPIAKAKLYSSLADERVTELTEIEAEQPKDDNAKSRWEAHYQDALTRAGKALAVSASVKSAIDAKYETSTDNNQKAALFDLSKDLQKLADTRSNRINTRNNIKWEPPVLLPEPSSKDVWNYINTHDTSKDAKKVADEFIRSLNRHFKGSELNPERNPRLPKTSPMIGQPNSGDGGNSDSSNSDSNNQGSSGSSDSGDGNQSNHQSKPCDAENTIPDPNFPGMCYANNSLIQSGVNQILHN